MNVRVGRRVVAAAALWVVLSRPDLVELISTPMWDQVPQPNRWRFGLVLPAGVEGALFMVLHLSLAWTVLGRGRAASLVSGILLYHFAPLETLVWTPAPYLRGLTIPALALVVLSCVPKDDKSEQARPEFRWPLLLVQLLFCEIYLFSAYSKFHESGLQWFSGENMSCYLRVLQQAQPVPIFGEELAYALASSPWVNVMGPVGVAVDAAVVLTVFVPSTRRGLLPLALAFHAFNLVFFHVFFQSMPLLLLLIDWSRLGRTGVDSASDGP